jgi:hypothetical protein
LLASEQPGAGEAEVPGRPRYAASPVAETPFDVEDTVTAAEQLVDAQTQAAEREAASAVSAKTTFDADAALADFAVEARTTAVALQRTTGQRSRRD